MRPEVVVAKRKAFTTSGRKRKMEREGKGEAYFKHHFHHAVVLLKLLTGPILQILDQYQLNWRPFLLLLILPELLNAKDIQLVPVYVRQKAVGLSDRLTILSASTVSHQVHAITYEGIRLGN